MHSCVGFCRTLGRKKYERSQLPNLRFHCRGTNAFKWFWRSNDILRKHFQVLNRNLEAGVSMLHNVLTSTFRSLFHSLNAIICVKSSSWSEGMIVIVRCVAPAFYVALIAGPVVGIFSNNETSFL